MGERDAASREAADARARLSELALELGRRTNPELVKEHARELVAEKRTELTAELKTRAKEKAVRTTMEMRRNPKGVGTFGALLGAGVGAALARRFLLKEEGYDWRRLPRDYGYRSPYDIEQRYGYGNVRYEGDVRLSRGTASGAWDARRDVYMDRGEPYEAYGYRGEGYRGEGYRGEGYRGEGYRGEGFREEEGGGIREKAEELKERASEAVQSVKEKASDVAQSMRERTGGTMESVRERVPSREELSYRAEHMREYARETAENRPLMMALGALAFGFIASQFLPVTERERRVFVPAKQKARVKAQEAVETARAKAEEKIGAVEGALGLKKEERREEGGRSGSDISRGTGEFSTSGTNLGTSPNVGGTNLGAPGAPSTTPSTPTTGEGRIGPLPPLDDVTKRGY